MQEVGHHNSGHIYFFCSITLILVAPPGQLAEQRKCKSPGLMMTSNLVEAGLARKLLIMRMVSAGGIESATKCSFNDMQSRE